MASYYYNCWETINLASVTADTDFKIYDRIVLHPETATTGLVFTGRINNGYNIKNLNEILSQYVKPDTISFDFVGDSTLYGDDEQTMSFSIYYSEDGWGTYTSDAITLTYNWSYNKQLPYVRSTRPINLLDYRQMLIFSIVDSNASAPQNWVVTLEGTVVGDFQIDDATVWTYLLKLNTLTYPGAFSFAYSYDYDLNRPYMHPGTYNTIRITSQGQPTQIYYVTNTCYKYCLYYLNSIGGWDYMLFGGRELQNDNLSRLSYKKDYVAQSEQFAKVDYITFINEAWQLNTSYMNDLSSSKMIELLGSNRIYLQDLDTQMIIPVNITNSKCEHKTYKNQGRKLYTYQIDVEASQPKFRI